MNKYLIGYVSKTGTTQEIAEKIAAKFMEHEIKVDVLSLENIENTDQYAGIILGSPINAMKLLPELNSFIESNENIKKKSVGIFVVSYIFGNGRKIWNNFIQKDINRVKSQLAPKTIAVFGGRLDKKMPGFVNFLFGLSKDLPLDNKNWNHIDEWANELVDVIKNK